MKNIFVFIFIGVVWFTLMNYDRIDISYKILVIINSFIAIYSLFLYQDRTYTLSKIVNLFILFFFILANSIQYNYGSVVTPLYVNFSSNDYILFQFYTLLTLLIFNGVYSYKSTSWHIKKIERTQNRIVFEKKLVIFSILATIIVLLYFRHDPIRLLFRGLDSDRSIEAIETGVASSLLFSKILRPIPVCCCLLGLLANIKKENKWLLVLLALITSFPTGLQRNAIAMYWLPVLIVSVPVLRRRNMFVFTMLFGLLIVFPFFDNFRYYDGNLNFTINFKYLNTMNFDASQEMMFVIKHDVITYGRQLLGSLLFFIPRIIWPDKPVGSGAYIADTQGVFSNISMPFFGEGYINFGFIGFVGFVILLGIIFSKLDTIYWSNKERQFQTSFTCSDGYYLISLSSTLFLLRGDLMSSLAYMVGCVACYYLVMKISTKEK